jgi:prepilin-type processing-associated H-X9-DG protein
LLAVAALVIACLIPMVERSREASRLAVCKENLRKIGAGVLLYAQVNSGNLPISPTVENPHVELIHALAVGRFAGDPKIYYCPSLRDPSFSEQNFKAGITGYYYYSALAASTDAALSKFLRSGVTWPRHLSTSMDPKAWVMSDIWASGVPTAHAGYRKGINYLMLDGSVEFVGESPRQAFH